ncbi:MAG: DUF3570 domain-containing protein [SAR324 cluster bacterium]|nr:DUF3570 domain-containing protein [SAR324 cluster bacterium]
MQLVEAGAEIRTPQKSRRQRRGANKLLRRLLHAFQNRLRWLLQRRIQKLLRQSRNAVGVAGFLAISSASLAQDQRDAVQVHAFQWRQSGGKGLQTFNGMEDSTIVEPIAVINTTLGKRWSLSATADTDAISVASESADEVDSASGASGFDRRSQQNFNVSFTPSSNLSGDRLMLNLGISNSHEYDYRSQGGSLGVTKEFLDRNFVLALQISVLNDRVKTYPITSDAARGEERKETLNFAVSATQILTRKSLLNVSLQWARQDGLLSRPLNSVAVRDELRQVERLPDFRNRWALRSQYNQHFAEQSAYHLIYRFYNDDWGVQAHTLQGRLFHELFGTFEVGAHLRYHAQRGLKYWKKQFDGTEQYATSDSDLEDLNSFYNALDAAWITAISEVDLRFGIYFGNYQRSNGLRGNAGGLSAITTF